MPADAAAREVQDNLEDVLERTRTGAVSEILVAGGRSFDEILHDSSRDADLVMMGMAQPGEDFSDYLTNQRARAKGLPTTIFVLAAEDIAFREVLFAKEG